MTQIPNILAIAGSDPSGGAGIQADLKAISANGAYAMAALTALTAQNTRGVTGAHLPPPGFVADQIAAVFADIRVDAVKIGMLANAEIAAAVADALAAVGARNIVLDPVMIATSGDPLLAPEAVAVIRARLVPMAAVITPNLPEGAALVGAAEPKERAQMTALAAALLAAGPEAVLLKGGHLPGGDSPDLLVSAGAQRWFDGTRLPGRPLHGGGCTLSAAIAAWLGRLSLRGGAERSAVIHGAAARALRYTRAAIEAADALTVGGGARPLQHFPDRADAAAAS